MTYTLKKKDGKMETLLLFSFHSNDIILEN